MRLRYLAIVRLKLVAVERVEASVGVVRLKFRLVQVSGQSVGGSC